MDKNEISLRLAEGLMASGDALAVFAPDDSLYYASRSFHELYHVPATTDERQTFSDIIRHCFSQQLGPIIATDDIEQWLKTANAKRRSEGNRRFEIDFLDGRWMWASETTFADGWVFLTVTDFTRVKHKEFTLEEARDTAIQAAETDFLTGMLNRRGMMNRLEAALEQTPAPALSIALLDLDHFKSINDTFGHDTGDAVLQHFATCVRETLREKDYLGRTGGEEFLLIMNDASASQACWIIERLQHYIRTHPFTAGATRLNYTLSGGIAVWQQGQSLKDLYHAADQALYHAKAEGRNRLKCA